jgi:murein DD-endopeptidase MepM/ murein hydrolase activator NlpD
MRWRWCLSGLSFVVACATSPTSPEPPLPPGRTVVVQPGQTLSGIARESGVSVADIVEANGLVDADAIRPGQTLFLPEPPSRASPPPPPTAVEASPPAAASPSPSPSTSTSTSLLTWPVDGVVVRDFVPPGGGRALFEGILVAAPAGTEVVAAQDGVVAFAGSQGTRLGTLVIVDHGDGLVTVYGHLSATSVKAGQRLTRGQALGVVGTTGLIGVSPRVYFEVRKERAPVDPWPLLEPDAAPIPRP